MFIYWMEAEHNHDNGYIIDCFFYQDVFPLRESNSIISGSGRGFTVEELFGLNCIIVYFIYLRSKAVIWLTELFSIFFSILSKFCD